MSYAQYQRQFNHTQRVCEKIKKERGRKCAITEFSGSIHAEILELRELIGTDETRKFLAVVLQHYPPQITKPRLVVNNVAPQPDFKSAS